MARVLVLSLVAIAVMGSVPRQAAGAVVPDSINFGYGGTDLVPTMPHCMSSVYTLEYEHPLGTATSLLGRGNLVDYTFDNGTYREHGILRGLDIGFRYYPAGVMQGWFTGASLGYWSGNWVFLQGINTPAAYQGTGHTRAALLNLEFGDKIQLGASRFSLVPHANIGKFFSSNTCSYDPSGAAPATPCAQQSEVSGYLFVGIAIDVSL